MDILSFEDLTAEMLNLTDDEREELGLLTDRFEQKFGIDFDLAFQFAKALIDHTPIATAGLSEKRYHAFVSKTMPVMLMKKEAAPCAE